jgi:hypothetical protein
LLISILPISLKVLNIPILSENILPFLEEYVLFIKKFKVQNDFHQKVTQEILLICKKNSISNFIKIDDLNEEYNKFQEYRNVSLHFIESKEIMILFKNAASIQQDFCLKLIESEFEKITTINEKSKVEEIELSLFLFNESAEIFPYLYLKNENFHKMFISILQNGNRDLRFNSKKT